jgi:hypothetical protein
MESIKEVYGIVEESFYGVGDYRPLLRSIGDVLVQVDDDDYQGDARVLIKDGERYGVLIFGWGSCSGCDALQACETIGEIEELRDELCRQIFWGTKEEIARYIECRDWEATHLSQRENREFVDMALQCLK